MEKEHPDWPQQSTPSGAALRTIEGLQNPGNPRRALLALAGVGALVVLFVLVAVVLS